jgi:hypothetical protein
MSAVKNVIKNNFRNMELNEFFAAALKDAGYGGMMPATAALKFKRHL